MSSWTVKKAIKSSIHQLMQESQDHSSGSESYISGKSLLMDSSSLDRATWILSLLPKCMLMNYPIFLI